MSSTHEMDGSPLNVDDVVYDVTLGEGRVEQLLVDGRFTVKFAGVNRSLAFDSRGVTSAYRVRTLFWRNPVLVVPLKDDAQWTKAMAVCRVVVEAMNR